MINLYVRPRVVINPDEFVQDKYPGYSIGIDGFVKGAPFFKKTQLGPKANFNHHEDVDRLATRSTCAQIHIAIKQGFFDSFHINGDETVNMFVNDCDQDVCLSVWLVNNHDRIDGKKSEPLITRLVNVTDLLDTTAGAYPIAPETNLRRELGWIYEPFSNARIDGRIPHMKESEMKSILESVCYRINQYSLGKGQKIKLDTRYNVIGEGPRWQMIEEIGFDARSALFSKGYKAFIAKRDRGNGRYDYSYGKISSFINIPLFAWYDRLNKIEGIDKNSDDCHGGSDTIGGSPREAGSGIIPKDMIDEFNKFLKELD